LNELSSNSQINIIISNEQLDVTEAIKFVTSKKSGAIATFLGNTRDNNLSRSVKLLEYESYQPMANKKLFQTAEEMLYKWDVDRVSIAHRIGKVPLGQTSLIVVVASKHRDAAFEACRYSIDRIKEIVPIWKKEYYEDGEIWIGSQSGVEFSSTKKVKT